LFKIIQSSRQADRITDPTSLEGITQWFADHPEGDLERDFLLAFRAGTTEVVGYSRLMWYSSLPDNRLYCQISYLLPEYRGRDYWTRMVRQNDRRLQEIAADHAPVAERWLQAWATDAQSEWIAALEKNDYQIVRRFNNMLHPLDEIPERPWPAGFEIRPVEPRHFRAIWEAQKEMNVGLFENSEGDWTEESYPDWEENAVQHSEFWVTAWVEDRLAGMVLSHIGDGTEIHKNRGYTEHIFVRPPWRKRGLAGALIVHSLRQLKARGVDDVELGVDANNASGAHLLYQGLGYRTYYVDLWLRKALETR
jgi:GNAT superfamily N-acetyltransferase